MITIIIGKYELSQREPNGPVWISIVDDGEGGEFNVQKFEEVIEKF